MQTLQQVENYTALSERASEYLLAVIRSKPDAVICLATGATPLLTYHYLVEKIHQQQVDVSQLTFVKLDEWVDLPLTMPGTCETFLQQHIVQPLGLREDQLISFHSEEINETECERVTNLIARKGGLDLCVLGLGKNGHLGLNEPGESLQPACHISQLDARTQQHEMLKTADRPVTRGITLGLEGYSQCPRSFVTDNWRRENRMRQNVFSRLKSPPLSRLHFYGCITISHA